MIRPVNTRDYAYYYADILPSSYIFSAVIFATPLAERRVTILHIVCYLFALLYYYFVATRVSIHMRAPITERYERVIIACHALCHDTRYGAIR